MRIPFDYLLENLRCGENFQVVGRPVLSAYMARPKFLLSDAPLEPGRLYISFTEELPCSVEKQPSSSAILTAPDPARLFNRLQELYDRCEAWEEALCNAASGGELRELLDEVESILDNPILLHKSNYAIVACSGEVFSNPALAALRGSHLPYDYVNTLKRDPVFEQSRTASAPFFYSNPFTKTPALGDVVVHFTVLVVSQRILLQSLHDLFIGNDNLFGRRLRFYHQFQYIEEFACISSGVAEHRIGFLQLDILLL